MLCLVQTLKKFVLSYHKFLLLLFRNILDTRLYNFIKKSSNSLRFSINFVIYKIFNFYNSLIFKYKVVYSNI